MLFGFVSNAPSPAPWSLLLPLIVISAAMHRPSEHAVVVAATLGCLALGGFLAPPGIAGAGGAFTAGAVIACVTMSRVTGRARVGVRGRSGELLLDDLRLGLLRRGRLPRLCAGWAVDGCVRPAAGHAFSGDFIVSHHDEQGRRFEAALVDVSGKGLRAASLAVQLSGALDGLIGAVPAEDFLATANAYVARQDWQEGFATAVHVAVDLETGDFTVYRAGHPPAVLYRAATSTWAVVEDQAGPALGLVDGAEFRCDEGTLGEADALLLYSDGVVECPDHGLDDGIASLLRTAADLVTDDFASGAGRLCEKAVGGNGDDRGVILLRRDADLNAAARAAN